MIVVGQMVMAIDHGGRRAMPTGGLEFRIGGWLLGTQVEATTGAWTVHLLHGAPLGVGEASEGRTNGVQVSSLTTVQSSV